MAGQDPDFAQAWAASTTVRREGSAIGALCCADISRDQCDWLAKVGSPANDLLESIPDEGETTLWSAATVKAPLRMAAPGNNSVRVRYSAHRSLGRSLPLSRFCGRRARRAVRLGQKPIRVGGGDYFETDQK